MCKDLELKFYTDIKQLKIETYDDNDDHNNKAIYYELDKFAYENALSCYERLKGIDKDHIFGDKI